MLTQHILLLIGSQSDDSVLLKLAEAGLWNEVKLLLSNTHFWFLRTENLVGRKLEPVQASWKTTYYVLREAARPRLDTRDSNAVRIFLSLETDIDSWAQDVLSLATEAGHLESLKLMLADKRFTINQGLFTLACKHNQLEVARFLLSLRSAHPQVDPMEQAGQPLIKTVRRGNVEVARFLLSHPRVDPSRYGTKILDACCKITDGEMIKLLLSDSRVEVSPLVLFRAINHSNLVLLELMLADSRIDASDCMDTLLKSAIANQKLEVIKLLLDRPDARLTNKLLLLRTDPDCLSLLLSYPRENAQEGNAMLLTELIQRGQSYVDVLLSHQQVNIEYEHLEASCAQAIVNRSPEIMLQLLRYKNMDLHRLSKLDWFELVLRCVYQLLKPRMDGLYTHIGRYTSLPPEYRSRALKLLLTDAGQNERSDSSDTQDDLASGLVAAVHGESQSRLADISRLSKLLSR